MNVIRTIFWTTFICFFHFDIGYSFIPLAAFAGGALSSIVQSICRFKECCTDDYIARDLKPLKNLLEAELHDQHLATKTILDALEKHIGNENHKKALAISIHGSSGTGKTHMANLIVDALYKNGAKSNYVHYYNGISDFHLEKEGLQHQHQIQKDVTSHLGSCSRSIFIFDKVDHIPHEVLDGLIPFFDYNPRVLQVDPTEAIFIFLSNVGAVFIEKELIGMWKNGIKREETKLEDFESVLAKSAFNEEGGFYQSDLIKMNFIDHYVPFLPLEETHVRKCIDAALEKRDFKPSKDPKLTEMIEEAVSHMTFGPPPHNLYSEGGCKRVSAKVSAIVERSQRTNPSL